MADNLDSTYSAWSHTYDSDDNVMLAVEREAVSSLLEAISAAEALDAATGTGHYAVMLAKRGCRVFAFDANKEMLAVARDKGSGLDITFTQGELPLVPFKNLEVDVVTCTMALAHVAALEETICNLAAVLRTGGSLLVSDLHPDLQADAGPGYREFIAGAVRAFPQLRTSKSEYSDAFRSAGLKVAVNIDIPVTLPDGRRVTGLTVFHCHKTG